MKLFTKNSILTPKSKCGLISTHKVLNWIFVVIVSLLYSYFVSSKDVFHSDWAEFYLLLDGLLNNASLSNYYMPPNSFVVQTMIFVLPFFKIFGLSYKSFFFPSFTQTFINVIALYHLTGILISKKNIKNKIFQHFLFFTTLLGPLVNILNVVMYRKDIPLILLSIYYLNNYRFIISNNGRQKTVNKLFIIIIYVFFTLEILSDPFVFYVIGLPLIIIYTLLYFANKIHIKYYFHVISYLILAIVIAFQAKHLIGKHVLHFYTDAGSYVSLNNINYNFKLLVQNMDSIFPFLGFFGNPIGEVSNIYFISNLLILCLVVGSGFAALIKAKINKHYFAMYLFSLPIFNILVYVFSNRPTMDSYTARYLVVTSYLFYFSIFYLLSLLNNLKNISRLIILVLIFHFIMQLKMFASMYYKPTSERKYAHKIEADYDLIKVLQDESLTKGFANYWNASSNTYYAKNTIKIRPIICLNSTVYPLYWFVYSNWFDVEQKINKSFIYLDSSSDSVFTNTCTIEMLRKQFDNESEIVEVDNNKRLYIWKYDISSKIPKVNIMESSLIR